MDTNEKAEINSATDVDVNMDMDTPYTEEQVEAVQAEELAAEQHAVQVEVQAETQAEAILDEANLAVQKYRGSLDSVDITTDKLSSVEQELSDSILMRLSTGPGAFKSKTMGNTDQNTCRKNVKDVVMFGDDLFKLMSKASSEIEGWMKSTKGMDTGKGCVIQVTTQQRNQNGSYSIAEALTYVSGVTLVKQTDEDGNITGRRLKGVR